MLTMIKHRTTQSVSILNFLIQNLSEKSVIILDSRTKQSPVITNSHLSNKTKLISHTHKYFPCHNRVTRRLIWAYTLREWNCYVWLFSTVLFSTLSSLFASCELSHVAYYYNKHYIHNWDLTTGISTSKTICFIYLLKMYGCYFLWLY